MGMFDHIKYEIECPECGHKINGFQSKDGPCQLYNLDFWEVDSFYALCENCKAWIAFNRKAPKERVPIDDYEMTVQKQ